MITAVEHCRCKVTECPYNDLRIHSLYYSYPYGVCIRNRVILDDDKCVYYEEHHNEWKCARKNTSSLEMA